MTQSIARQGTTVRRQVTALVRMELILLRRNWNATLLAVVTPLLTGFLLARAHGDGVVLGVYGIAGAIGFTVLFSVHYHLTTVYAARRQELVLKRLRAGQASGRTILAATALSGILVFIGQAVVLVAFGLLTLDLPLPANPLTMMLTMFLGAAVLAALAAALSGVTRSSEAAMFTTMPSTMLLLATPGVLAQPGTLPQSIESVGAYLPLAPFVEVLQTGWLGRAGGVELSFLGGIVDALPSLGLLTSWLVLALLAARYFFRWEPRQW